MSRIPLLAVEDLTPEDRERYYNVPGARLNASLLLAHAKGLRPAMQKVITAIMHDLEIPPLDREICILAVLHLERGAYQWAQHLQVAESMGIAGSKVEAIADERFGDCVFDEREKALLAFTRQVVRSVRVDNIIFDNIVAFYSPRQLVELIHVIGIYMLLLRVSEVAQLEIDAVSGADYWRGSVELSDNTVEHK